MSAHNNLSEITFNNIDQIENNFYIFSFVITIISSIHSKSEERSYNDKYISNFIWIASESQGFAISLTFSSILSQLYVSKGKSFYGPRYNTI
jgi:hypothetical protein